MADIKLEFNLNVDVKIVGNGEPLLENQITIVCEPFAGGKKYNDKPVPDFSTHPLYRDNFTTQNVDYKKGVLVFNPISVEEVNGKLKCNCSKVYMKQFHL